ncbi:MAG: hypothetical protein JSR65_12450 [Proteobacteria bacterium]|nr:hypothetical protein [Pseudomonadota bacterium]
MQTKTMGRVLCLMLALLAVAGCGRSKPQTAKAGGVDTSALENTAALPPDQQPPKPAVAAPVAAPGVPPVAQADTGYRPNAGPGFRVLPPGQDHAWEAERQKFAEGAAKIADDPKYQERERQRLEALQKQEQSENGQSQ